MNYVTVCKPGDIFYGRERVEYEEIRKIKVLSILITAEGIEYCCESKNLNGSGFGTTWYFTEDDFKTLMFKTPEAAQKDLEARRKLYDLIDDYHEELRFEDNLEMARKLIEQHILNIDEVKEICSFSDPEYLYVKELFREQSVI